MTARNRVASGKAVFSVSGMYGETCSAYDMFRYLHLTIGFVPLSRSFSCVHCFLTGECISACLGPLFSLSLFLTRTTDNRVQMQYVFGRYLLTARQLLLGRNFLMRRDERQHFDICMYAITIFLPEPLSSEHTTLNLFDGRNMRIIEECSWQETGFPLEAWRPLYQGTSLASSATIKTSA